MKKLVAIVLTVVMVLGMTSMAFANGKGNTQPPKIKEVDVSLTGASDVIEVDDVLILNAYTEKHGQLESANWSGTDSNAATTLNEDTGMYESTATFTATSTGTFNISYAIRMTAGKSHVEFTGTNGATVEVINGETVIVQRITITVREKTEVTRTAGPNTFVDTVFTLDVEIELSNGDIIEDTITQEINHSQTQRNVTVTYENEDEDISFSDSFFLQKSAVEDATVYTYTAPTE